MIDKNLKERGLKSMKKIKKLISLILSAAVMFSFFSFAKSVSYAQDSTAYGEYTQAVSVILKELSIMQGDGHGNMNFENYVSRSEFTKIAVMASQWRDYVVTGEALSVFPDVKADNWAAPFVRVGVKNKMFTGYPDGTFKPNKTVLYEEAVNVYLNMLGYDENDIGSSWPSGPVALANNIGLNKGLDVYAGKALTRYETAIITYNMLKATPKNGSGDYINKLGYTITEDCTLIATHDQDVSIGAGKVYTTAGTYEMGEAISQNDIGLRGDLIVKDNKKAICLVPSGQKKVTYTVTDVKNSGLELDGKVFDIDDSLSVYYKKQQYSYKDLTSVADDGDEFSLIYTDTGYIDYAVLVDKSKSGDISEVEFDKYVVYSVVNNDIIFYKDSQMKTVNIPDNTVIYKEDSKTTYAQIKNQLSMGDILYLKFKDSGKIDYAEYEEGDFVGPVTAKNTDWRSALGIGENKSVSIMRNGTKTDAGAIMSDDILYYCKDLDLVLAYYKTVTGVYEKAVPNKDMPTSVVISGKTYNIEGIDAFNALSSSGSTALGDTITVLLGKDSEIAGVLGGESGKTVSLYGYLTEVGTSKYENQDGNEYSSYYVKVVLQDGSTEQYASQKEYDDYLNSVVKVTIENGKAIVTKQQGASVSGYVDYKNHVIGNSRIASDIKILDIKTLDDNKAAAYASVFAQRIDGIYLSSENVCYASKNSNGEIEELILKDVTGDSWTYGIVSKINTSYAGSKKVTLSYDVYNKDATYQSSITGISGLAQGAGVKIGIGSKGVETSEILSEVKNISQISANTVIGNTNHTISDKVNVYKRSGSFADGYTYYLANISDAVGIAKDKIIAAYYDKADSAGGRVRVIVIEE